MTDKEIRQYIKQILSKSHCPYQARRKIFTQIYGDIQQYLAGHPGCAREDVYHYFGSPDEAGHQYMTNLPPKALRKKLCLKKAAQTFLVCLCAVILLDRKSVV